MLRDSCAESTSRAIDSPERYLEAQAAVAEERYSLQAKQL